MRILTKLVKVYRFRFNPSGSSYSVDTFSFETVRSIPASSLRLDIGADGVCDWGYDGADAGSYGMQNRLADGESICQTPDNFPKYTRCV